MRPSAVIFFRDDTVVLSRMKGLYLPHILIKSLSPESKVHDADSWNGMASVLPVLPDVSEQK